MICFIKNYCSIQNFIDSDMSQNICQKCSKKQCEHLCEDQKDIIFNSQCPVCLEEDGDLFVMTCAHQAHLDCLKGMIKNECPICRKKILNLNADTKRSIEENASKYREEQIEQDRQTAIENSRVHAQVSPQLIIFMALKYMDQLGFPTHLLPQEIRLTLDPSSPLPPAAFLFEQTVSEILKYIQSQYNNDSALEGELEDFDDLDFEYEDSLFDSEDDENCDTPNHRPQRLITIPRRHNNQGVRLRSYLPRELFNIMNIIIEDLPEISDQDLEDILN